MTSYTNAVVFMLCLLSWLAPGATLYVSPVGNDEWDGTASVFIADVTGPKATLQAAITAAANGDIIVVADGVFTGVGNRNVDFNGKQLVLQSENGPDDCIIDCQGTFVDIHRAFVFQNGETEDADLLGTSLARKLLDEGARGILGEIFGAG